MIKISLKFVAKGPINIIPALVQIMAWRRPGICASLGINELIVNILYTCMRFELGHYCARRCLYTGIILSMRPANERRCYIATLFLIDWTHAQNDPCLHITVLSPKQTQKWKGVTSHKHYDFWITSRLFVQKPIPHKGPVICSHFMISSSEVIELIKMPVRYILSSVWVRLTTFSQLSIIQYMFSVYPFSLSWLREYILCLIIIIKSDEWTIIYCLELGHETMVCAVCLCIFLWTTTVPFFSQNYLFNQEFAYTSITSIRYYFPS